MNERSEEGTNASDTEVELDADQLAALARLEVTAKREERLTTAAPVTVAAPLSCMTSASGRTQSQRRSALLRTAVPVSLLVAAVATAGAIYSRSLEPDTLPSAPRSAPAPSVMPDWVTQEIEPQPQPQPEPVRFANPFDKNEVFEFPAGTSKEDARAAVANILLERASERRATDPKLRSKLRSVNSGVPSEARHARPR